MEPVPGTSAPMLPPGGLFEMAVSFDTTGSMSRVIDEVKGRLQDMIQRLQADIPGIRFGVIAHGDYCDKNVFYLEKHIDLTTNIVELTDFVKDVEGTGGGDPEECYEYALRLTRELSWTPGSRKALVMIGDSIPHEPDYDLNTDNIDWKEETTELAKQGVKIYGVQAFEDEKSTAFFQEMALATQGEHIKLGDFSNICDFIMAICYREVGDVFLDEYEAEVRAREARMGLHKDLEGLFGVLRRGDSSASNKTDLVRDSSNISSSSSIRRFAKPLRKLSTLSSIGSVAASNKTNLVRDSSNISSSFIIRRPAKPFRKLSSLSSVGSFTARTAVVSPIAKTPAKKAEKSKQVSKPRKPRQPKVKVSPKAKASKKIEQKYRHQVTDSEFILMKRNLDSRWSPWTLALTGDKNDVKSGWKQRRNKVGWRKEKLFTNKPHNGMQLYEIAAQKCKGCKYNIVYSTWCHEPFPCDNWEQKLVKTNLGKRCLQTVLKNGGRVFVRRFVKRKLGKVQSQLVSSYDNDKLYQYAWTSGLDKPGRLAWAMDES